MSDLPHLDDAFGHWLAGLIDGEGCFRIHMQKGGTYYAPTFSLKLRDDDMAIIDTIIATTGIGRKAFDEKARGTSKPCVMWIVNTREMTEALMALLNRFPLRARKSKDYAIWREAVLTRRTMRRGNAWHGPTDWTPMIEAKRRIEEARVYAGRG